MENLTTPTERGKINVIILLAIITHARMKVLILLLVEVMASV